jgi:hypothetical protein
MFTPYERFRKTISAVVTVRWGWRYRVSGLNDELFVRGQAARRVPHGYGRVRRPARFTGIHRITWRRARICGEGREVVNWTGTRVAAA